MSQTATLGCKLAGFFVTEKDEYVYKFERHHILRTDIR